MKKVYLGMLLGCAFVMGNLNASSAPVSADQVAILQKQIENLQKQLMDLSNQVKAQEIKTTKQIITHNHTNKKEHVQSVTNCPCPTETKKTTDASVFDEGYIPVSGNSAVKVSGVIKVDAIMDAKNHTGEQVIPFAVPYKLNIRGVKNINTKYNLNRHFYMHAKQSKFWIDAITKNSSGNDLTGKIEADFFGETQFATNTNASSVNYKLRLRHAYFDYNGWCAGFTTTTFHTAKTLTPSVDMNGISAGNLIRQPLISYTYKFGDGSALSVAAENPRPDYITYNSEPLENTPNYSYNGRDGISPNVGGKPTRPDLIARLEHTFANKSIISMSVIQRDLSIKYNVDNAVADGRKYTANGYGANLTGKLMVTENNFLSGGYILGRGLGQYIIEMAGRSAILSDTANNPAAKADRHYRALPMYHVWLGYSHTWNQQFQTNIGFAYSELKTKLNATRSPVNRWYDPGLDKSFTVASINTIYKPETNMEVGLEYMFIKRESTLKYKAIGSRYQLALSYKF